MNVTPVGKPAILLCFMVGCAPPPPLREAGDWEAASFAQERGISLAEARQRLGWQALAPRLQERAATELGETFGGVWIAPGEGDRVKVAVTSNEARTAARRVTHAVGLDEAVDHVVVRYSLAELTDAKNTIAAELSAINLNAEQTMIVGISPERNAVRVDLPRDGRLTTEQRTAVDSIKSRFGDRLVFGAFSGRVKPSACVYPDCDAPLRGGVDIRVQDPGTSFDIGCTGGFTARSQIDSKLYQFTAGHCTVDDNNNFNPNTWWTFLSDGTQHNIGPTHHGYLGPDGDMAIVEVTNTTFWGPQNWVLVTDGNGHGGVNGTSWNARYDITSTDWSVVGQRICITGSHLGASNCGVVTQLDVTYVAPLNGTNFVINHAGRGDYCAVEGDSGAPLYANNTAFGLQSASAGSECDSLYQGIRQAEDSMNVYVLTAPQ
jgi:hypothetical protein